MTEITHIKASPRYKFMGNWLSATFMPARDECLFIDGGCPIAPGDSRTFNTSTTLFFPFKGLTSSVEVSFLDQNNLTLFCVVVNVGV